MINKYVLEEKSVHNWVDFHAIFDWLIICFSQSNGINLNPAVTRLPNQNVSNIPTKQQYQKFVLTKNICHLFTYVFNFHVKIYSDIDKTDLRIVKGNLFNSLMNLNVKSYNLYHIYIFLFLKDLDFITLLQYVF